MANEKMLISANAACVFCKPGEPRQIETNSLALEHVSIRRIPDRLTKNTQERLIAPSEHLLFARAWSAPAKAATKQYLAQLAAYLKSRCEQHVVTRR